MSIVRPAAALLGLLVAFPALSAASTPQTTSSAKAPSAKSAPAAKAAPASTATPAAKAATHATRGVVKAVDSNSLVITRAASKNAKAKEMTFVLNSTTQEKGTPAVGATVEVRYKTEAKQNIATAVNVQPKK